MPLATVSNNVSNSATIQLFRPSLLWRIKVKPWNIRRKKVGRHKGSATSHSGSKTVILFKVTDHPRDKFVTLVTLFNK